MQDRTGYSRRTAISSSINVGILNQDKIMEIIDKAVDIIKS